MNKPIVPDRAEIAVLRNQVQRGWDECNNLREQLEAAEAERDALIAACIDDTRRPKSDDWKPDPSVPFGPWYCHLGRTWHWTRDEAVAAVRKAAGLEPEAPA